MFMLSKATAAWISTGDLVYSLIVIHLPLVDKHTGTLRDVITIQHRRFCRTERDMGGGEDKLRGDLQLHGKAKLGKS